MTTAEIQTLVMELANQSIQTRGYFPIASTVVLKRGRLISDLGYLEGHPLAVIGETTEEDFRQYQSEAYARCPQRWLWFPPEPNDYKFYYKVTAE